MGSGGVKSTNLGADEWVGRREEGGREGADKGSLGSEGDAREEDAVPGYKCEKTDKT